MDNMVLITKRWAPIAREYTIFLNRHKLQTVYIISGNNYLGYEISVYADEEKYLELSLDEDFELEEKQFLFLFDTIEYLAKMWQEEIIEREALEDELDGPDNEFDENEADVFDFYDESDDNFLGNT